MDPIIILSDSDEESSENVRKKRKLNDATHLNIRNPNISITDNNNTVGVIKRIAPITITRNISKEAFIDNYQNEDNFNVIDYSNNARTLLAKSFFDSMENNEQIPDDLNHHHYSHPHQSPQQHQKSANDEASDRVTATPGSTSTTNDSSTSTSDNNNKKRSEKTPLIKVFQELLDACRKADESADMELLINKKLIRYYQCVHPDFINSKSFTKTVTSTTNEINANPKLVYLKLSNILEELNIRRKSGNTVVSNEEVAGSTGNKRKDEQILRLNKALYILKKRIAKLEESEVDFSEEINSSYMMVERYKKRAFEIYEKICDITGESKHAHRTVRKPVNFNGTHYPEFNRTIQIFVNRTNTFPDFYDVLKCLQHCNTQYGYKLKRDEMTKIAQDAFIKVGKTLQNRRKADLYETVSYFTGAEKDPANEDMNLMKKLEANKQHYSKIADIIDKFAKVQDNDDDDDDEGEVAGEEKTENVKNLPQTSDNKVVINDNNNENKSKDEEQTDSKPINSDESNDTTTDKVTVDKQSSIEIETDSDDDDEEDESLVKENVKPDLFDDIVTSDDEELQS
uniref:Putative histone binding domain of the death-domain associated protein n=1 Tax=Corethrella appendiculata TaxID=1370023 RepID=U5EF61_9DIPT